MATDSSHDILWKLREGGQHDREFGTALAALIYMRWADFQESEQGAIASFDDTDYKPVLPSSLHWRSWCNFRDVELSHFLKERLPSALRSLHNNRHNPLSTYLYRLVEPLQVLSSFTPEELNIMVLWLSEQPFETPSDRRQLLNFFDDFLNATTYRLSGDYRTSPGITNLIVELASTSFGDRVYDPCFRSGELLTGAYDYVRYKYIERLSRSGSPALDVSGIELNPTAYLIGLVRLTLSGIDNPQLELGNALERTPSDNTQRDGFDVVLVNPPFGLRADFAGLDHFAVRMNDATGLFIQHALAHLRSNGRAVIVVPQGFLYRRGPEQRLRRLLMEKHTVEAIVSLPRGVLLPYTGIQAAILVLRKTGPTRIIRMLDAETFFDKGKGDQALTIRQERIEDLAKQLRDPSPGKYCWDVNPETLAKVDWDFTPKRRDQSGLDRLIISLSSEVEVVTLKKFCHIMAGRSVRSENIFKNKGDTIPLMSPRRLPIHAGKREGFNEYIVTPTESLITEEEICDDIATIEQLLKYALDRHLFITWDAINRVLFDNAFRFSKMQEIVRQVNSIIPGADALLVNYEGAYYYRAPIEKHLKWLTERGYVIGPSEDWTPYVRISDIQQGWINKASSWICSKGTVRFDSKWKLKGGDILLSRSGTIGKAGIVRNGGVGAIAAAGLFVLRPDQDRLDPHFLLAYLTSKDVRAWLDDRARGATIRHLSTRTLEDMPVPLPPLQVQQRVATEHREHGVDPLAFLTRILTLGEEDPVAAWVDKASGDIPRDMDVIDDPLDLSPLDRLAVDILEIRNRVVHGNHGESALAPWLLTFCEAISGLRGIAGIPRGPGLLSVLQETAKGLSRAMSLIKEQVPNETMSRDLTRRVATWIDRACSTLLGIVKLVVSADTVMLPAGDMAEMAIDIHNQGPLPLRSLHVTTRPDWGCGSTAYLAENEKATIALSGIGPKKPGSFTLDVTWSAETLDGKTLQGAREITLEFLEKIHVAGRIEAPIGGSPYVCGDPIRPERNDVFFGREELLDQIRRQILQSGNVVLLEGNRRAGKSSILWHLEGPDAVPGWMGIYCSLQGAEGSLDGVGIPTVEVFREMAKSIATRLHTLGGETPLPDGSILAADKKLGIAKACRKGITSESPFSDFRDYIEIAVEKLAEHDLGLLLMLDEFEKLQEGIDSGITSPQVPENIRFLVQTYPRFSTILTGSRRLKRLREEYFSVLYGLGTRFGVSYLSAEAARLLVTEPVKGKLTYSREAVEHAFFLTAGHPYLLQCLCNRVFDLAVQLKTHSITLDVLLKASDALVEDNEHFASLWDYIKSDRRRFILALCHRESGGPDVLGLGVIQEKLLHYGVEVDDETLIGDLDSLRELELIEKKDGSSGAYYFLTIPLMGSWIEKQRDFAAIRIKAKLETEDQHG